MVSVNEKILDREVSHQIGILRRAGSIRDRLIKHLKEVEADLTTRIVNRASRGDFTQARMELMLKDIQSILNDAKVGTLDIVKSDMKDLAIWEAEFNKKLINASSPVNLSLTMPSETQLKAAVTSQPFRGKLLREWVGELHRSTRERARNAIRIGFTEGQTTDAIARNLRDNLGIENNAEALVRTATNHTASTSRAMFGKENEDVIKNEMYVATLDSRTTPICQSLDGKVIPVGGHPRPPQHVNCRSTTTFVTKSYRELGFDIDEAPQSTRASMNGQVPSKTTYNEWLKRQDVETQNDALGKTKAQLFRKGEVPVSRFVDSKGNTLSLDELKKRDMEAFRRAGINPDEV